MSDYLMSATCYLRYATCYSTEFLLVAGGGFCSATEEGVDGGSGEAGGGVTVDVDLDDEVTHVEIGLIFVLTVDIDNLHQQLDRTCDVVGREGVVLHGDADDDVGAHLASQVGRVVVK